MAGSSGSATAVDYPTGACTLLADLYCPSEHGLMEARHVAGEPGRHPAGARFKLSCGRCGWVVWMYRDGLPVWHEGSLRLIRVWMGQPPQQDTDVAPEDCPEVARRIRFVRDLAHAAGRDRHTQPIHHSLKAPER